MGNAKTSDAVAGMVKRNPKFKGEAYQFVLESIRAWMTGLESPRHVSAEEVADAVRVAALKRFGPLARSVLEHWGLHSTRDIGLVVFTLVDHDYLVKRSEESLDDFAGLYRFDDAFRDNFPWSAANR